MQFGDVTSCIVEGNAVSTNAPIDAPLAPLPVQ
mgnify:FL=1